MDPPLSSSRACVHTAFIAFSVPFVFLSLDSSIPLCCSPWIGPKAAGWWLGSGLFSGGRERVGQGCIRRAGASEGAPEAVRWAFGGDCQSGWRWLLSVTNAIEAGICRRGDSGRA